MGKGRDKRRKKNKAKRRKRLLSGHKQVGKKFIPPFLHKMPAPLVYVSWVERRLPEVLWTAYLHDEVGVARGNNIALQLAKAAVKAVVPPKKQPFCLVYEYEDLPSEKAQQIVQSLPSDALNILQKSLWPLVSLYRDCPFKFLFPEDWEQTEQLTMEDCLSKTKRIVYSLFDKTSTVAIQAQACAVYLMFVTDCLKIAEGLTLAQFPEVAKYPDTELSRMVAAAVRSTLISMVDHLAPSPKWPHYFWRHGLDISVCEVKAPETAIQTVHTPDFKEAIEIGIRYRDGLASQVKALYLKAPIDLAQPSRSEVLFGLLARQTRLASVLTNRPELWSIDIGRILLRCMVDTHITLNWLSKRGKPKDFAEYIEYGLGQEKLLLEHLKTKLDKDDPNVSQLQSQIDGMEAWINSQLMVDFLPVNIGSWTSKTIRKMAEETESVDIFNLAYAPYSSVVHGMWNTIERLNLQFCHNPLHRFHRIPDLSEPPLFLGNAIRAVELMDETLKVIQEEIGTKDTSGLCQQFIEDFAQSISNDQKRKERTDTKG